MKIEKNGKELEIVFKGGTGVHQEKLLFATSDVQEKSTGEAVKNYLKVQYELISELSNAGTVDEIKKLSVSDIRKLTKELSEHISIFPSSDGQEKKLLKN